MQLLHQLSFYIHVSIGAFALLVFWIPVVARKGSLNHKRFGRFFASAMYAVAFSGLIMSSLDMAFPLSGHTPGTDVSAEAQTTMAQNIRMFALFLFSLSILVLATTRQGWLAIQNKADRTELRAPLHVGLNCGLVLIGATLLFTGVLSGEWLFSIFGGLEIVVGLTQLHYSLKAQLKPQEWWIEHLGGLTASGIAAYTAFFVFGGSRVINQLFTGAYADVQILLWVAPGVAGGLAITILSRRYTRRFAALNRQFRDGHNKDSGILSQK